MKISLDWLSDFVEFTEKDPHKIADIVTSHVAEVEDVIIPGELLENCCVGKVISLEKHPNADKLSMCEVETDKGKMRVVCGGTNLRDGMRVAFAHVGAKVRSPDGGTFELSSVKIRGEESNGMICAHYELELSEQFPPAPGEGENPVVDLGDGDEGVGKSLKEYLDLGDVVLDVDNHALTHRADLFSHIGFARECVAVGIAKWKKEPTVKPPVFAKAKLPFKTSLEKKELMPRYCSCLLEIEGIGETPEWMKKRLIATGWRPVSLPVDITNYVAMEIGVPLHSFDADDIKGNVVMRKAKKGEKIVTLDSSERELSEGALILADDEGIFDLLGIMGGLRSSTKEGTKHIFMHSATLDPVSIRSAMIGMGHRTDAGTVYEKGVPPYIAEQGFYRAVELFTELVPGAKIVSSMESYGDNGKPKPINLSLDRIASMLGKEITEKEVSKILSDLGFTLSGKKNVLSVTPPLWRMGDIDDEQDLIEEVGRVYGYHKIEPVLPAESIEPPARDQRVNVMRGALKEQKCLEILPLSFVSPALVQKASFDPAVCTKVRNPIGEETSLVQPSVLPSMLAHAEEFLRHSEGNLKTFTASRVFESKGERSELGLLVSAKKSTDLTEDPFLLAKADVTYALKLAGYTLSIEPMKKAPNYMHPGRSGDIVVEGKTVGSLFEIHPSVRANFGLPARVAAALIDLDALLAIAPTVSIGQSLPEFPAVSYDVTVEMDHGKKVAAILEKARATSELLESIEIADLYAKEGSKTYNLTLRCTYRASDRTLKEEEAKKEHSTVEKLLS